MGDATTVTSGPTPAHSTGVSNNSEANTSTVIVGAGVIGCATAYYLSRSDTTDPRSIHLIEASPELFASASGKSGGFLAEDWFGEATASLGALSFRLHRELAAEHDGSKSWGHSRSTGTCFLDGIQVAATERGEDWLRQGRSRAEAVDVQELSTKTSGPAWLVAKSGDTMEALGEEGSVAQVDPLQLCHFLLSASISAGVHLHQPTQALRIRLDAETKKLNGLHTRDLKDGAEREIACTRLLITAGAWTPQVFETLFPTSSLKIPITSLAGHSLVVRSPKWQKRDESGGCHAVFTTMKAGFSPEIFSRIGGEIYVAGLNDASIPLPSLPTEAKIDPACIEQLKAVTARMLGCDELDVVREGLCFRPVTPRGTPIVDRVPDNLLGEGTLTLGHGKGGVFIAAGHGPWGISQSLGTGKVMAEMMEDRSLSADLRLLRIR